MNTKFFILILSLFFSQFLSAQTRNCDSHEHLLEQIQKDPKRADRMDAIEKHTAQVIANQPEITGIITIPVVFHIVYNTPTENISTAQIQSQLDILTEDFRRQNSDANNTWSQAADTEIEFCLADTDPNGNVTTGITRTQTSSTSFSSNNNVKFTSSGGHDAWPAADYMNFWVCDLSGGLLGYAQFPGGPASTDGIVCDYQYVGNIGTATAPFDLGRTATHEVGHYLNLRHIWGDGGCGVDDFVADTPTSDASNGGCATGHVSCGSVDMVENYMDYSDDACMNLYTQGQKDRMRAIFDPGGARESLLSSAGCSGSGSTCTIPGGLNSSSVGETTATVSWNSVSTANDYDLEYKESSASSWTSQNISGTSFSLTGLTACTAYDFRVRTNCTGESSNFSSTQNFSTVGCPSGCPTNNEVTLTLIPDDYGSETTWEILDGTTVLFSGGPYQNNNSDPVIESFCLDNGCYDFAIYDSFGDGICCGYGNGSYSLTDENNNVLASGGEFADEEITNFCVSSTPPPAACEIPTPTKVVYPYGNNSLVSVFWTEIPGASKYAIRYRVVGTSAWTIKRSNTPARQLNNIDPNEIYEYRLAARCSSGWTSYSGFYYFSRNLDVCISPVASNVTNITSSSAKLWWHRLNNATNYRVIYRPVGTTSWTVSSTTSTNMTVQGLDPSTTYEFKIKGFCQGAWTDYSLAYHFITSGGASREMQDDILNTNKVQNISLRVYPNPTRGIVNISLENVSENAMLQVFNVVGEQVKVIQDFNTNEGSIEVNLTDMPEGMYIIRVEDGEKSAFKKLTIVK